MRIQFYESARVLLSNGTQQIVNNWIEPISCSELYADEIVSEASGTRAFDFFTIEFSDPFWICPKLTDLRVGLNPYEKLNGTVFTMVVNECNLAKSIDDENGITSYAQDVECATDATDYE